MTRFRTSLFVALVVGAALGVAIAQSPVVWTVDSVGYFTSGGKNVARRIVLRGPLTAAVPGKNSVWTLQPYVPPPVDCAGTWSETVTTGACLGGSQTVTTTRSFTVTTPPANGGQACPASPVISTTTQACTVPALPLWGATVDPWTLGTCSAEVHDRYILPGGDGWRYRTWHPQRDPSGCVFAHEHGDNPARMTHAEIAAAPILFGYVGRRMVSAAEPTGHDEPHEGFKVFIALPGDVNDEGRVNRVFSRSVFHMGTGGPRRFGMQHHSASIRLVHPEFGLKAFTQLMMDTGGVATVCDPRVAAPTKDVVSLGSPCRLNSFYEIWSTFASVMYQGREVYRAFATPAVFDPITVFNPANPTELVYAWDRRVDAILNFPGNARDYFRGCDRESYAQPGYWYNAGGRTTYTTDAHGQELPAADPRALVQEISASASVGVEATNDGLKQFKMRRSYCGAGLGLKN